MTLAEAYGHGLMEAYVPYWHSCVYGPVTEGETDRIKVEMDYLLVPTELQARVQIEKHLIHLCEVMDMRYDAAEWDVDHVRIVNGN